MGVVDEARDLYRLAVAAFEEQRYTDMFWALHERTKLVQYLSSLSAEATKEDLVCLMDETQDLIDEIMRRYGAIEAQLASLRRSSSAMRAYAESSTVARTDLGQSI